MDSRGFLLLVPVLVVAVQIAAGWRQLRAAPRIDAAWVLGLVGVSLVWLTLGAFAPLPALGANFSTRRYVTIGAHVAMLVVLAIYAGVRGRELRRRLLVADLGTLALWLYAGAVSSAV